MSETIVVPKRASSKGAQIVQALIDAGDAGATRSEVAGIVGCTVQRVGEAVRAYSDAIVVPEVVETEPVA